jgi:hypothetical protein
MEQVSPDPPFVHSAWFDLGCRKSGRAMAAQTTRQCHWVSQSYLRSFSVDGDRDRIWRFSKTDGDPELKRIKKVAVKHHLYAPMGADGKRNDAVEKKLGELEKWFGHGMWALLCNDEVDLTWEPLRKMLALIVATTYVRNPAQFESWKSMHRQFVDQLCQYDELPTHVTIGKIRAKVDPSDWPAFRNAGEEEMKAAWNNYVAGAGDIAPKLLGMRFAMIVAKEPVFITSDNPVTIIHPSLTFKGIGDPETMVIFPLSPTRMLVLDNRKDDPDGAYYALKDENPAPFNSLIWRNAIDHMFSSRHTDQVLREINADADQIMRWGEPPPKPL